MKQNHIKDFSCSDLETKDFIHVKSLLLNCICLKSIRFDSFNLITRDENIGDELLDILTKFSPKALTDITISGYWKCSVDAFERFFESCRTRTLLSFVVICAYQCYITEDHRAVIRKYVNEGVIKESNCT